MKAGATKIKKVSNRERRERFYIIKLEKEKVYVMKEKSFIDERQIQRNKQDRKEWKMKIWRHKSGQEKIEKLTMYSSQVYWN